jgi:gas vesicle protein
MPPTPVGGVADEGDYHETDWQQVAIFGAGLALGLALGAGTALLTAPQSGEETRAALRGRARRFGRTTSRHAHDAWDELRDELHSAKMALRRRRAKRAEHRALRREQEHDSTA